MPAVHAYQVTFTETDRNVMVYATDKAAVADVVRLGILASAAAFGLAVSMPAFTIKTILPAKLTAEDHKAIKKATAAQGFGRPARARQVDQVRELLADVAGPITGARLFELLTSGFDGVLPSTIAHVLLSARAQEASAADVSAADRVRAAVRAA